MKVCQGAKGSEGRGRKSSKDSSVLYIVSDSLSQGDATVFMTALDAPGISCPSSPKKMFIIL